jgi:hypothetical protein
MHVLVNTLPAGQTLGLRALRAVADEQELCRNLAANTVENFDHIENSLHRPEIREVDQNPLVVRSELLAALPGAGIALIEIAIHKIPDHLDGAANVELLQRAFAQIIRNRSHAITFFDGEARDRQIRGICADQGDVCAMQGGDERQAASGLLEHLLGEQCRNRMRDCVVHVQQVEFVNLGHLGHARGQREIVRRELEQRIVRNLDLVVMKIGVLCAVEPEGRAVCDEVHLMAALGQL